MIELLNAGCRFQSVLVREAALQIRWPNGKLKRGVWLNKFARRIARRRGIQQSSSIESAITKARRTTHEAQSLATNSHEAKRYVAMARIERHGATPIPPHPG